MASYDQDAVRSFETHGKAIASVASVTVANVGDNVGAYVPLFARQNGLSILLITGVFLILTDLWCIVGKLLVSHPILFVLMT